MSLLRFEQTISTIHTHQERKRVFCEVNYSLFVIRFLKTLRQHNFIYGFRISKNKKIQVYLRYVNGKPMITKILQVSKSSSRRYAASSEIKNIVNLDPTKVHVLTTSEGLKSGNNYWSSAYKKACGEVLCTI